MVRLLIKLSVVIMLIIGCVYTIFHLQYLWLVLGLVLLYLWVKDLKKSVYLMKQQYCVK